MSILAECPFCLRKQSLKNKLCSCGEDLDKLKRSRKVRYWINYRLPGGKQRRELVGYSITEARDAEGKRRSQKREGRIFDMLPESKMTFSELSEWYLALKTVKKITSYERMVSCIKNFNAVLGDRVLNTIKPIEIENYQELREEQGRAAATIDLEISIIKSMINKAFDNDMVEGRILKVFRSIKPKLRIGSNARKRTLTFEEYLRLLDKAPIYLKSALIISYNTGMRGGEIKKLKYSYIDRKAMFIRLPAEITKEKRGKNIPINCHVKSALDALPRALKHDFVLTYQGKPLKSNSGFRASLKKTCIKAGVPYGRKTQNGFTFHDIRRTAKTNMANAGVNKVHRDTILGHTLQGMDIYYLSPTEDSLRQAMDKYTKWLDVKIANVDQSVDQKRFNPPN